MDRIEKGLHEHHAHLAEQGLNNDSALEAAPTSTTSSTAVEPPFAKVNSVVDGSPADTAGLKTGDTITKFGWLDWTNNNNLGRVAEAVSQNEGVSCFLLAVAVCNMFAGAIFKVMTDPCSSQSLSRCCDQVLGVVLHNHSRCS